MRSDEVPTSLRDHASKGGALPTLLRHGIGEPLVPAVAPVRWNLDLDLDLDLDLEPELGPDARSSPADWLARFRLLHAFEERVEASPDQDHAARVSVLPD